MAIGIETFIAPFRGLANPFRRNRKPNLDGITNEREGLSSFSPEVTAAYENIRRNQIASQADYRDPNIEEVTRRQERVSKATVASPRPSVGVWSVNGKSEGNSLRSSVEDPVRGYSGDAPITPGGARDLSSSAR